MKSPLRLLAIDLGAESGRGIVGTFDGDGIATFREPPLPERAGAPARDPALGLPAPLRGRGHHDPAGRLRRSGRIGRRRHLGSRLRPARRSWALAGESRPLPRRPDRGDPRARLPGRCLGRDLPPDRYSDDADQHALPAAGHARGGRSVPRAGGTVADDAGPRQLLPDRPECRGIHDSQHEPVHGSGPTRVGYRARGADGRTEQAAAGDRRARNRPRYDASRSVGRSGPRRHPRGGARFPRHRVGRCGDSARRTEHRISEFGHMVVDRSRDRGAGALRGRACGQFHE